MPVEGFSSPVHSIFLKNHIILPKLHALSFLLVLDSNVPKAVLIPRVIFCSYSRSFMRYTVSETFDGGGGGVGWDGYS